MKNTMQIATECELTWNEVSNAAKSIGIEPAETRGKKKYFDIYQEDLIHQRLYQTGKLSEITYESKMNLL